MGNKHSCLPCASEVQYREYVDHPAQYRQYLSEMLRQYPELFRLFGISRCSLEFITL